MHGAVRRQLHEWAQSVPFEEVLEELQACPKDILCSYCESEINVYFIEWNRHIDFYCLDCFTKFIKRDFAKVAPTGSLKKRFMIFERDEFKCVYCGRNPKEHNITLEIEHVYPKSKGGSDSLENLVTSCRECNAGKGDYILKQRENT